MATPQNKDDVVDALAAIKLACIALRDEIDSSLHHKLDAIEKTNEQIAVQNNVVTEVKQTVYLVLNSP